jgi:hypothetical protein
MSLDQSPWIMFEIPSQMEPFVRQLGKKYQVRVEIGSQADELGNKLCEVTGVKESCENLARDVQAEKERLKSSDQEWRREAGSS